MNNQQKLSKGNNNFQQVLKTLMFVSAILTPLMLIAVTYLVINSNFDGLFRARWGREGGEILIDRRHTPLPDSPNQ